MQRYPMTEHGAELLKQELQKLKQVDRPKVIQAIAEARAQGDLRENAEYDAAKEQQGFIEARIKAIENKLSLAQIIAVTQIPYQGRVIFGTTVTLHNLDTEKEVTYQIVGEDEADINLNKISYDSPIARAIISKEEGDEVVVNAPNGPIDYEIVAIKHI